MVADGPSGTIASVTLPVDPREHRRRTVALVVAATLVAVGAGAAAYAVLGGPDREDPAPATGQPSGQPSTATADGRPCATAATLRVATYNIKGAAARSGGFDLGAVARDLAAWDVDVALLQEVYRYGDPAARRDQPAQLASALGAEPVFGFNTRKGGTTQYGTAVLSRHPIVGTANVALPNRGGLEQRGLLRATLDLDGTTVDVFDTHLQHTPQAADLRVRQARSIARVVGGRASATGYPAVLGGDFNSSPTGSVSGVLQGVLSDTWSAVGSGRGATAPAGAPRARIDRLYHSADLVPLAATVRPATTSDHRAVTASYAVPAAPGCG